MSCGTKRISEGIPPTTADERKWDALRFLNTPSLNDTITREERDEIEQYLNLKDANRNE